MAFLFWLVPLGVGIAAGIALERRVLGRLTPLTGGTTRGGVLVGTVHMAGAAFVVAVGAVLAAGLGSDGHTAVALGVAGVGNVLGAALAEPLLPWISNGGWRFVRAIAADARAAGVPRPAALGLARAGATTGYVLVWPAVFASMVVVLDVVDA